MPDSAATADFDDFYRGTAPRVIHIVYAMTGDLGLAQDCAQEAYARAWQQWDRLQTYHEPIAWVRTVARRLAISQWRKRQNEARAFSRTPVRTSTPSHAERTVTSIAVTEALAELPQPLREVLALFYLGDLSIEQISRDLDAPVGTVKTRLHRGRAALASRLGPIHTAEESRS